MILTDFPLLNLMFSRASLPGPRFCLCPPGVGKSKEKKKGYCGFVPLLGFREDESSGFSILKRNRFCGGRVCNYSFI